MPYPLTTPRLAISPLTVDDAAAFLAYRQDPEVARWQGWDASFDAGDAAALIAAQPSAPLPEAGEWVQLAVRERASGLLLGDVAVQTRDDADDTYEIGVTLARASQRQGFATEAVGRVLAYLFDEGRAHRVTAYCDSRNAAVARLLTGLGMRRESRQVDAEFFKDEWITLDGYALLQREHALGQR